MTFDQQIQQALKWWFYRQSIKLFLEAEKIRDDLLQESFSIRRSLDLLTIDNLNLPTDKAQEFLQKFDNFDNSLVQLSDRLFPASLHDSLPLAIECLLKPWLTSYPQIFFQINMPASWRLEPMEHGLIILRTLEELLIITLSEVLTPLTVYIGLEEDKNLGKLTIRITYPDVPSLLFYSSLPDLEYLYQSFRFLVSGKCFCHHVNLRVDWYFYW